MKLDGKVVVITGGGSGIGKAMAERFRQEGAENLVIADLDGEAARAVAESVGGLAVQTDVSKETDVQRMVELAEGRFGRIDLMCSNAGVSDRDPDFNNA